MRRAPLVSLCAAAALAVAGLVPAATAQPTDVAQPTGPAGPDRPPVSRAAAAQRTLDAVESALTDSAPQGAPAATPAAGRDLTLLLRDLRFELPALRGDDRAKALAFLARPTDGANDPFGDGYTVPSENDCGAGEPGDGSPFCVHWVTRTADAPPLTDVAPDNGIPDQVDHTRATMRQVWKREVGDAGFKRPLRDAGPPKAGPNRKFDVYLADIGADRFFGYCATEPAPGRGSDAAAYCVLDDDYSPLQFRDNTPLENLQVTAAHEFFHAIQFAYDAREDVWLLEGTATWIEDEIYDAVDDNRSYLDSSPLTRPGRPLDKGSGFFVYGTWLWWRFLSEQHPADGGTGIPRIVRRVWEAADDSDPDRPGTYSLKAVRRVLAARGASLTDDFAAFGVANRQPQTSYEEGGAYDAAPVADSTRISATSPAQRRRVARVDHLATRTVAYTPGAGLAQGGWRLRARVEVPAAKHSPAVSVTTFLTDGTAVTKRLKLGRDREGVAEVGFDSDTVRRVELTFSNAGHRYDCREATSLSCRGLSRSNDRGFAYRVRLTR